MNKHSIKIKNIRKKHKKTQNKKTQNKKTQNKKTQNKKTQNKKTQNKKTQNKKTQNKKTTIIKNNTPINIKILSRAINREIKSGKSQQRSYSPQINRELVSLTKRSAREILICGNDFLTINIGSENKPVCVQYNDPRSKKLFLNNLKNPKIDCNTIIPPKQYLSNCWFNTLFMTFFISDKGRKFFKYFRQLMIEGKDANENIIPAKLSQAFFIFNLAIESAQNHLFKNIAYLLNTNLLIKNIYEAIKTHYTRDIYKKTMNISSKIIKIGDAGNPVDYYETIMTYLNNNSLNIKTLTIYKSAKASYIEEVMDFYNNPNIPDVIILEIYDDDANGSGFSGKIKDKEKKLILNTKYDKHKKIEYTLDAVIIRDTEAEHFCSLLTCNGEEYAFDGASYNRMSKFSWKNLLNKNKKWGFEGHHLKWNFMNAYQILYYYRV